MKRLLLVIALFGLIAAPVLACPPPGAPVYDGPGLGSGPGDPSSTDPGSGGTDGGQGDSTVLPPNSIDIITQGVVF